MKFLTKKWTVRIILHMIDFTMSSTWLAYRNNMTELGEPKNYILYYFSFRLSIANTLIHGLLKKPSPSPSLAEDENDEPPSNHRVTTYIPHQARQMPGMVGDRNHRRRCRNEKCSAFTTVQSVLFNDDDDHGVHDGDHGDDPHDGRDDGGDHDVHDGHDDGGDRDVHDGRGGGHGDHDDDALPVTFNDDDDHDAHDDDHGDDPHDGRDDDGDHDARDGHDDGGDHDVHDGRGGGHGDHDGHDDDALLQ
ncbi:DDE_Tnp_1_7 domain-containing protein [Trichonephila inaurata madagascariensis]|uniref:DDE_Tnp_1_7 domain-containing protein n=1 Tax=Trichonephila inaurata madagascariensis TaxID=2747483 RepID=A0A8X6Y9F4_9ARAC|nr:DDE_Tnp_1_7 domain-containing protein [Trichonephila inaurata madagascariensis]